jgi:type I restriction enzyme S subunit
MKAKRLFAEFDRISEAPGVVDRFRTLVVALALRGSLTEQDSGASEKGDDRRSTIHVGMTHLKATRPRYRWAPQEPAQPAINRVPRGWCRATIGDTGLYINGLAFKPSDWGTTGRPIIRIQNLSGASSQFNYTDREVDEDGAISTGDLLVSWSATLDTFVWSGPEGVLNQHIFKVVPNQNAVVPGFLYWLLKHEVRKLAESQHAHGLAMMHINRGPFLAHPVVLPPIPEQQRIVGKLVELMALCGQLEEAQVAAQGIRSRLLEAILHEVLMEDATASE